MRKNISILLRSMINITTPIPSAGTIGEAACFYVLSELVMSILSFYPLYIVNITLYGIAVNNVQKHFTV